MRAKWLKMKENIIVLAKAIYYSFPFKLFLNHIRKNQLLLVCWLILFLLITGNLAKGLGATYLFLDPEYLDKVDFIGYFVIGISLGFFTMSFQVTSYILDSFRFNFLGAIQLPFLKFTINNSLIPLAFLLLYTYCIYNYQQSNEFVTRKEISLYVSGLWLGFLLTIISLFIYFVWNSKKVFRSLVQKVDEQLRKAPVSRANVMHRVEIARKKNIRVENYLSLNLLPKKVPKSLQHLDRQALVKVFDQHQFNLLSVEILIVLVLAAMGLFSQYSVFQLPAAASIILLLTVFLMIIGAITWWFREWALSVGIALVFGLNFLVATHYFQKGSKAYGLDYQVAPVQYNPEQVKLLHSEEYIEEDYKNTLSILRNWRNKFPAEKNPPMVLICTSGGGQRAAMWSMRALQVADSLTNGELTNHTMLFTGASGGAIGAAYYRELLLASQEDSSIIPYHSKYLESISQDHLNTVIFNFLANDLFVGQRYVNYQDLRYPIDRGYAFEQRLSKNTFNFLDKPLKAYKQPEFKSQIPMMVLTPTIINDGRKLYISPHKVSYFANKNTFERLGDNNPWKGQIMGVDFQRLFKEQQGDNLRFLSALRMSATFPYVTPNVMLPSEPELEIMDAGMIDNFGVSDALRFLYTFRKWIERNTSQVIVLSIRDTEVGGGNTLGQTTIKRSLFNQLFRPIEGFYENFNNIQDFYHQEKLTFAEEWYQGKLSVVTLEYQPGYLLYERMKSRDFLNQQVLEIEEQRASLSWRLTGKEKRSIVQSIYSGHNKNTLNQLQKWLKY